MGVRWDGPPSEESVVTPDPLTVGELLAILAVLIVRLGRDHPLTRRVQDLYHAQPEGETHE